jgi:hypothetical protein
MDQEAESGVSPLTWKLSRSLTPGASLSFLICAMGLSHILSNPALTWLTQNFILIGDITAVAIATFTQPSLQGKCAQRLFIQLMPSRDGAVSKSGPLTMQE